MSVPASILEEVFTRRLFAFAGFTSLLYDYSLTFSLEVDHIWSSPWTTVKVLFLINRYGNLIWQAFMMLEETGHLSRGSQRFCRSFVLSNAIFAVFSGESIRLLIVMRACAVGGCKRSIAKLFITLYVLYGTAMLVAVVYITLAHHTQFLYLDEIDVCFNLLGPYTWVTWLASICLDTIVFVTVCYSLCQLPHGFRGIFQSRLTRLLVRDAALFYYVALFNSLSFIICWTVYSTDPRNFLQTSISFALLSNVGQRVVLNLRRLRTRPNSTRDISREVNRQLAAIPQQHPWLFSSSLQFSSSSLSQSRSFSQSEPSSSMAGFRHVQVELQDLRRDVEAVEG